MKNKEAKETISAKAARANAWREMIVQTSPRPSWMSDPSTLPRKPPSASKIPLRSDGEPRVRGRQRAAP